MTNPPDIIMKLNSLRDMDAIMIGKLNNLDHLGLHIQAERMPKPRLYGRIIEILHGQHYTAVKVRWNGQTDEIKTDPEQVVRVEVTI